MKNITLIIPAKNEADSLPSVLDEVKNLNFNIKILLQEDDVETISAIKRFDCEILFQPNKGYGDALIHGIDNCDTEYFCIFNADGSFDPRDIIGMYDDLNKSNQDIIFASRYQKDSGSNDDTLLTLIGNYFFTFVGKIFFSLNISDILYTFVLGKTEKVKKLGLEKKDFSFCVEMPIKAKRNNLNIKSFPSFERKRIAGEKKVNEFRDGFLILFQMIFMFFKK